MVSTVETIPTGNFEAKYASRNPISRMLVNGFLKSFDMLVAKVDPKTIHEVGCGEGELVRRLSCTGAHAIKGTDLSAEVFQVARSELDATRFRFEQKSLYDLLPGTDSADLLVCCEVLEHVEDPNYALRILQSLQAKYYIFSVPREPIWRILNITRLKYLNDLGNTPGHLNHWSQGSFIKFVEGRFEILKMQAPLPWTMVLCKSK